MTRADELLGALDPERRAQLEAARTSRTFGAVDEVLAAAGFPRRSEKGGVIDVYPLPSELSSEQRALAELVALLDLSPTRTAIPTHPQGILRWLGRSAQTATEREVMHAGRRVPLWRALQEASGHVDRKATRRALLDQLPAGAHLEALASLVEDDPYRTSLGLDFAWEDPVLGARDADAVAWARRVLSAFSETSEVSAAHRWAFLILARNGVSLEPAWDPCLPVDMDTPLALAVECAAAIPDDRREAAILARLQHTHAHFAIQHALALAARFDVPALAQLVIEKSERSRPHNRKDERARLMEIAKHQPQIGQLVAKLLPGGRKAPTKKAPTKKAPTKKAPAKKATKKATAKKATTKRR